MGKKLTAKTWLVISLILCFVSMAVSSVIQSSGGRVKVSELRLVDSTGHEVSVLLYKPKSATEENKSPAIVTVEGWFNNKEMQDLYSIEYARRGYTVIAVDMHGHGDTEITAADEVYSSAVGIDAAVALAASLPYVDKDKIGITGHSSGGAACDMEIAIDNERENPIVSAVLFQASTWCDDTGVDHSADFGTRNVGIIADKYDEFFFWTTDENGNEAVPRVFLTTPDAKNFVNFNNGSDGMSDVESGKYYEKDGAFRVIYQVGGTHPWVHFSKTSVEHGIDFFEKSFGAPHEIIASNQVWQAKQFFNVLGLVGIMMFVVAFVLTLVENTAYFGCLKASTDVKPVVITEPRQKNWFWISMVAGALFSALSYRLMIITIYSKANPVWPAAGPLLSGVWSVLNGLFLGAVILISNKIAGNNRINAKAAGIMMEKGKLVKTIYLSILTVTLAFGILFFADYFFKTDFRLWVLTLKAFDADKVLIGLRYIPLFMFYYIMLSIVSCCYNCNTICGRKNTVVTALFNIAGPVLYWLVQYIPFFVTGALTWYKTEGDRIGGIWLYPMIVFLFVNPILDRIIYKKTKNPYIMPIISAIIITMMCIANTTIILGGAPVVANNY